MLVCKKCGYPVVTETNEDLKKKYPYYCSNCDENMYSFETVEGNLIKECLTDGVNL